MEAKHICTICKRVLYSGAVCLCLGLYGMNGGDMNLNSEPSNVNLGAGLAQILANTNTAEAMIQSPKGQHPIHRKVADLGMRQTMEQLDLDPLG